MTKTLNIGSTKAPNRVILAPMSGITDAPFRRLAEELGAGLVVSEMTACAGLVRGEREAAVRSDGRGVDIHVVQLAGCEAPWMADSLLSSVRRRPAKGTVRWRSRTGSSTTSRQPRPA